MDEWFSRFSSDLEEKLIYVGGRTSLKLFGSIGRFLLCTMDGLLEVETGG